MDKSTELQQAENAMRMALDEYNELRIEVKKSLQMVERLKKAQQASHETDLNKILNMQGVLNIAKAQALDFLDLEKWTRIKYEKAFEVYANTVIEADNQTDK